jgi:Transposase IS116/IS110/IS902 family
MTEHYEIDATDPALLTPVKRLSRDILGAASTISDAEARFLVDSFYLMQDARIRADGQIRSIVKNPVDTGDVDPTTGEPIKAVEPHAVLQWFSEQNATLEGQVKNALARYVKAHPVGPWLMSIHGIGPVISAGLLAHIDIKQAATAGHIWRYAGLDPTLRWEKKTKRPWNAQLKVLCWKAGESFVMFHNNEACHYGHIWRRQKDVYGARNEAGAYAERAAEILSSKNFKKDTDAYKAYVKGKFPPAHIHAMARRYAVKSFLSDLQAIWYFIAFGKIAPKPWVIEHGGHAHLRAPFNAEIVPGLQAAYRKGVQ